MCPVYARGIFPSVYVLQVHKTHPQSTTIVAVHEDWPGGAGNGLGTLYAFQKAVAKVGLSKHEVDAVMD